jgi:hypothetical protein
VYFNFNPPFFYRLFTLVKMQSKTLAVLALAALAQARFGQEGLIQPIIQGLSNFGPPGAAGTLAGRTTQVLLAGANACDKVSQNTSHQPSRPNRRDVRVLKVANPHPPPQLKLADEIVETLGNDPQVIAGAQALVAAEKNVNPFAQDQPTLCDDPGLPATPELRGIVPLVDPAFEGADVQNANSAQSLQNPFNADGLSVAEVSRQQGFEVFITQV